jgi:hypothetical protein
LTWGAKAASEGKYRRTETTGVAQERCPYLEAAAAFADPLVELRLQGIGARVAGPGLGQRTVLGLVAAIAGREDHDARLTELARGPGLGDRVGIRRASRRAHLDEDTVQRRQTIRGDARALAIANLCALVFVVKK